MAEGGSKSARWRERFESSEADWRKAYAWQNNAIDFIVSHPECLGEAMEAGLVMEAPLIIGGREVGAAAVYAAYPKDEA